MIAIDDLRPELGCYGRSHIHSPHLDALAARGVRFDRAYCQSPVCGASRASMLSGLRPTWDRFFAWNCRKDEDAPDAVSLPMLLRRAGYRTESVGKVYHHADDDREAWDYLALGYAGLPWRYLTAEAQAQIDARVAHGDGRARGGPVEAADAPDGAYPDGEVRQHACERLGRLARGDTPFFLAVGFSKPHLPFNCPRSYWDLYDPDEIVLPRMEHPRGAPKQAVPPSNELRSYLGIPPDARLDIHQARELVHGYYACVSFVDAQVGGLLAHLDRLGLRESTDVMVWGDHGWNLGDHGLWCKHVHFETALRSPLIWAGPGVSAGRSSTQVCELLDLYPTIARRCGVDPPAGIEGEDLSPLWEARDRPIKPVTRSRYYHGDSVGSPTHRYTEWRDQRNGPRVAETLFDLSADPGETRNVASDPAYRVVRDRLRDQVRSV